MVSLLISSEILILVTALICLILIYKLFNSPSQQSSAQVKQNGENADTVKTLLDQLMQLQKENTRLQIENNRVPAEHSENIDALKKLSKTEADFKNIYNVLNKATDQNDKAAIIYAVQNGYTQVIGSTWNLDIITYAAYKCNFNLAKALVDYGADPNSPDGNGCSALRFFCYEGNLPAVKYFASLPKVNINCAREDGTTPLMAACKYSHYDVVEYLCSLRGIQVNARNNEGITALGMTQNPRIKQLLISNNCVE